MLIFSTLPHQTDVKLHGTTDGLDADTLVVAVQGTALLGGLGCGTFYTVCLMAATLAASGELDWQGANAMLPMALLLGGLLGGALAALRGSR